MTHTGEQQSNSHQLYWVADNIIADRFPDVSHALRDPDGLLAIGGDLSPARLLDAYQRGIFPWYSQGQPILWWSPNPRCVLEPQEFRISRSLRKTLRQGRFRVTYNHAFTDVIRQCAAPRQGISETWITSAVIDAYTALHDMGHGLSAEVWNGDQLAGGLYGVIIGHIYFGESMFSRESDASKVALAHLVGELQARQVRLIDCQVHSRHLQGLGAKPIPRDLFVNILKQACDAPTPQDWPREGR